MGDLHAIYNLMPETSIDILGIPSPSHTRLKKNYDSNEMTFAKNRYLGLISMTKQIDTIIDFFLTNFFLTKKNCTNNE